MISINHIIGYICTVFLSITAFVLITGKIVSISYETVIERCDKLNSVLINNTIISCNVEKESK